jgi:hypothetical protein
MSRPNSPPQAAAILDVIFQSSAFEMPPHEKALTQLLRDLHAGLVALSGAAAELAAAMAPPAASGADDWQPAAKRWAAQTHDDRSGASCPVTTPAAPCAVAVGPSKGGHEIHTGKQNGSQSACVADGSLRSQHPDTVPTPQIPASQRVSISFGSFTGARQRACAPVAKAKFFELATDDLLNGLFAGLGLSDMIWANDPEAEDEVFTFTNPSSGSMAHVMCLMTHDEFQRTSPQQQNRFRLLLAFFVSKSCLPDFVWHMVQPLFAVCAPRPLMLYLFLS